MQDLQIAYIYGNPNAVGSKDSFLRLHFCVCILRFSFDCVLWQDNLDFAQGEMERK